MATAQEEAIAAIGVSNGGKHDETLHRIVGLLETRQSPHMDGGRLRRRTGAGNDLLGLVRLSIETLGR